MAIETGNPRSQPILRGIDRLEARPKSAARGGRLHFTCRGLNGWQVKVYTESLSPHQEQQAGPHESSRQRKADL